MINEIKLIIPTSWKPDRKDFLTALGIRSGGFGEHLFGEVYDALFVNSIELRADFHKYYAAEYASLDEYLEVKYGRVLKGENQTAERVFLVTDLPQVVDIDYEENKLEAVLDVIKKLEEVQNEDKS